MAATVGEIRAWLKGMPNKTWIGIDEGGLILVSEGGGFFEIGGTPDDDAMPPNEDD